MLKILPVTFLSIVLAAALGSRVLVLDVLKDLAHLLLIEKV